MRVSIVFGVIVLAVLFLPVALGLWLDARWFGAQGLGQVFQLRLGTQISLGLVAASVAAVFTVANLTWAAHQLRRVASKEDRGSRGMGTISTAIPIVALA